MRIIDRLKSAEKLDDLAKLLGFTPRGLSYIVYKLNPENKYRVFEIAKKSGGTRIINAPEKQLSLLQTRVAGVLHHCVTELQQDKPRLWNASHGFQRQKNTISNANPHRRRRFVFNLDIEDFFGSINFGRVRGFFINDNYFKLNPKIATIIAQIACHQNSLPQGSPCSPVISNLIGNILDLRLIALARKTKCTYTRYADDLTFSTNEMLFPTEIATNPHGSTWEVGSSLQKEIEQSGFKINLRKTRMSLRRSRQTVTGLVVNSKVNIKKDYYRFARAMCNSVFTTGEYRLPAKKRKFN